jgi:hypothetical protein
VNDTSERVYSHRLDFHQVRNDGWSSGVIVSFDALLQEYNFKTFGRILWKFDLHVVPVIPIPLTTIDSITCYR